MREVTFQALDEDCYESDTRFCEFTLPIASLPANAQAHIRASVISALRDVFGHSNNIQCALRHPARQRHDRRMVDCTPRPNNGLLAKCTEQ